MTGDSYFSQDELRLKVGTGWVELEILSDVGVIFTRRGYAPAIRVLRGEAPHLLLVGAASLAAPLESIRGQQGRLTGLRIRTRKLREEQTSPYEVEVLP
jgi:hypothetical protein